MLPRSLAMPVAFVLLAGSVVLALSSQAADKPADAAQAKAARIARGRYLVQVMSCGDCHTPGTFYGAPDTTRLLSGSELGWKGPWGVTYAANLTPDLDTGLGYWNAAELAKTLRTGVRPDGSALRPPMPVTNLMALSEDDAAAIAAYLMDLKPVAHAVPTVLKPGVEPKGAFIEFPVPGAWDAPRTPPAAK